MGGEIIIKANSSRLCYLFDLSLAMRKLCFLQRLKSVNKVPKSKMVIHKYFNLNSREKLYIVPSITILALIKYFFEAYPRKNINPTQPQLEV